MTLLAGLADRRPATTKTTSLRDALIGVGALLIALNLVELAVPSTSRGIQGSLVDGVVVVTFTVTGLVAWYRRPHNATGRLMVATALAVLASGMQDDEIVALRTFGTLVGTVPLALLLHLLLAFPSGRLSGRAARTTVVAGYLVAVVPQVVNALSPDTETVSWNVQAVLGVGTLAATVVLASRRLSAVPALVRRQLLPFIGYGCVAIAVIVACIGVIHFSATPGVGDFAQLVQLVMLCGLPLAFVGGMTVGAFGRAGEVEEVARGVSEAATEPALLDDLMVRALGDPSARVVWATGAERDRFVDSEGTSFEVVPDRGWWPIGTGRPPAGGLLYDQDLVADTGLVATVTAPLELAIDNRRLVVELRSAIQQLHHAAEEVRTSRRRIVVAADAERRRIAQDLHDGAQQRVVVVAIEIQRLARRADDPEFVRSGVARIADLCGFLLDDLRDLVQGIMPSNLQDRGLAAAVVTLANQLPVPVVVNVVGELDRMDAEVESTGYFVVAEALTNAVKHAEADDIVVAIEVRDGRMRIEVTDDGKGPEGSVLGFGLRSLRDRVESLDGTLTLQPAVGRGTTLSAQFVCG